MAGTISPASNPSDVGASGDPASQRLVSIDAYRGLVMFLMVAEVLHLGDLAEAHPGNRLLGWLAFHQSHVEWVGCSLHDLIQPSFSFLAGVSLPFSILSRRRRGQSWGQMFGHALVRSMILIWLGVFLRSIGHSQTRFTFEDTLSQIGLGYPFLFLLACAPRRGQWIGLAAILVAYWAAFALYPLPGADFDWSQTGVTADWPHHLHGFAAHWNKNTNLAWAFDRWFLNLFPRKEPFLFNGGGYSTLSFIPTLGTMVLGLIAGGWLQDGALSPQTKIKRMLGVGLALIVTGYLLGAAGICPVVKRIWTPSWTLFSGGWCLFLLASFYGLLDVAKRSALWVFPLLVLGANSIAAYCLDHLCGDFIRDTLNTHFGAARFATVWGHFFQGVLVFGILWCMLYWMYRRRIFLRI
ncbi:MAG: hypothetical protein U0795_13775 [Pirellulales bacterium]